MTYQLNIAKAEIHDLPPCTEDPDLWFAVSEGPGNAPARKRAQREAIAIARALCHECPLVQECRDYATRTGQRFGVWGAMTPAERGWADGDHLVRVRGKHWICRYCGCAYEPDPEQGHWSPYCDDICRELAGDVAKARQAARRAAVNLT